MNAIGIIKLALEDLDKASVIFSGDCLATKTRKNSWMTFLVNLRVRRVSKTPSPINYAHVVPSD